MEKNSKLEALRRVSSNHEDSSVYKIYGKTYFTENKRKIKGNTYFVTLLSKIKGI